MQSCYLSLINDWMTPWSLVGMTVLTASAYWVLNRQWKRNQNIKDLKGKVVLITGASSGLGEALARAFHKAGCRLVLAARREAELCRVRDDLIRINSKIPAPVVLPMDMMDLEKLPELGKKALDIHGQIDIFISNAGISNRCAVMDCVLKVYQDIMNVNYFGHVELTKALLPSMIKRKTGHIVAISSIQGRISLPYRAPYAASKHALQAYCDALRLEVASEGLKVTVFSPGYIKTDMSVNALIGSGEKHAVMDAEQESGMTAEFVADIILNDIVSEEHEVIIAKFGHRIGIPLRTLFPNLFFWIMARRAQTPN